MSRTMRCIFSLATASIMVIGLIGACWAQTVITVGHRLDDGEVQWMHWLKEEFERLHPDMRVELVGIGWAPEFIEKLTILWAAGEFPDVFYGTRDKRLYIDNGWTYDLTPYFDRDRADLDLDDFFPGSVEVWNVAGRQYALPISISGQALYYNKEKIAASGLANPPVSWDTDDWSWSTMAEYARRLTRRGPDGAVAEYGLNPSPPFPDFAWTFGGDWLSQDSYESGVPGRSALHSQATEAAFEALVELIFVDETAPRWDAEIRWPGFWQGQIGMEWTGWWKIRNYIFSEISFPFGLAPPPKQAARANTLWNDPWFVGRTTEHPDAAWEFVKFATSHEGLVKYAEIIGMPPARRSAFDSFLENVARHSGTPREEILEAFIGSVNFGRQTEELIASYTTLFERVEPLLFPILDGSVSPAAGLRQAHEQLEVEIGRLGRE